MSERVLIVNADDFGRSVGINRGVIRCHEEGIVTSASLMVRWPEAEDAAAWARRTSLSVGLHLDLGDWEWREGEWHIRYEVVDMEDLDAIAAEIERQLARFERLIGQPPTHLDTHQHVHLKDPPVLQALGAAGQRLGVPVRGLNPGIAYSGVFYGQDGKGAPAPDLITADALVKLIDALPRGVTELGCHPASEADRDWVYREERVKEVEALCDPRVRAAIDRCGVALRSFADPDAAQRR
jgi:chitin disaccharide deacetylase